MQKILIKIGSSVILDEEKNFRNDIIKNIIQQVVKLKERNYDIVLLVSGAIGSASFFDFKNINKEIELTRKIKAGIGQVLLSNKFQNEFIKYQYNVCQILLTEDSVNLDLAKLINSIFLEKNIIPVVNANDLLLEPDDKTRDNDSLCEMISNIVEFDFVLFLSSVDGVMNKDILIKEINLTNKDNIEFFNKSQLGTGGMKSKIERCIRIAGNSKVSIINGLTRDLILDILDNKTDRFTTFKVN